MRILHTADFHLGKRLYGVDRLSEAEVVIDEIAAIAEAREVDAILVAGDILDRRIVDPSVLSVCLQGFERLGRAAPVVAITGNHDEPLFWAELAPYLAPRILIAAADSVLSIDTAAGPLTVACAPWPEPADVATAPGALRAVSREAYGDLVRDRLVAAGEHVAAVRAERGGTAVLLAHLMVRGGVSGGGERELTLGGTYAVAGGDIPSAFDYVALGHLHRPQNVGSIPVPARYSGSPLALDFSGDGVRLSVTVVDIAHGQVRTDEIPLTSGRRLIRLRGTLDDLPAMAAEHPNAWFFCEVMSDDTRLDMVKVVREVVPDALRVEQVTSRPVHEPAGSDDDEDMAARSLTELYGEWLTSVGRPADPELLAELESALERADQEYV